MGKTEPMVILLIYLCTLATTSTVLPVKAGGPVYIRADGTFDPAGAPLHRNGDLYTLTDNITSGADGIVIEKSNITIDGNGHTIQGGSVGRAFYVYGINNVTIRNMRTEGFRYGIYLESTSRNVIYKNNMTGSTYDGVGLYSSSDNIVLANNINENGWSGIGLYFSSGNNMSANYVTNNSFGVSFYRSQDNLIFHNNFISNMNQTSSDNSPNVWHDGYPSGGNYWADNPNRTDSYKGPNQDQPGSDGICDTPYAIDLNNQDRYPLMNAYTFTLPTDINKDGRVNILDIGIVARSYGTKPEDPMWNPDADLDKNGKIDILDIAMVAKDFGKST